MGKEIRIWGKPIFDFWGKLTPKMHAHLVIHPRPPLHSQFWELLGTSLTFLELLWIPHPRFYSFLHFPHDWEVIFAKLSSWDLGLTFLLLFPSMRICFCNAQRIGEKAMISRCLWRLFFPMWRQWTFGEIDFGSWGCFTHLPFPILASKTFLSMASTVIVVYASFGFGLIWFGSKKRFWTSLINLVCERTSQTDLAGWFSSLHTLNSVTNYCVQ